MLTYVDNSSLKPSLPTSMGKDIRAKAVELEGVFLNTLVSEMFSGMESESMFGGGFAEETWRSMQAEQYATQIAQAGGIGLADQIVASLLALQEAQGNGQAGTPATVQTLNPIGAPVQ